MPGPRKDEGCGDEPLIDALHAGCSHDDGKRSAAHLAVVIEVAIVVDGKHPGGDGAKGSARQKRLDVQAAALQVVGAAHGHKAKEDEDHQLAKGRVGNGLGAAHVRVGGNDRGKAYGHHDPAAHGDEVDRVEHDEKNAELDGALNGGNRKPPVGRGARQPFRVLRSAFFLV